MSKRSRVGFRPYSRSKTPQLTADQSRSEKPQVTAVEILQNPETYRIILECKSSDLSMMRK